MTEKTAWLRWSGLGLAVWLLAALPALAQDGAPVGRVVQQVGWVTILRGGAGGTLQPGDPVYRGDAILTGPRSRIAIEFADGSQLAVGSDSEVELERYLVDGAGRRESGLLALLRGIVRATVAGGVSGGAGFDIRTRLAVASTRSTEWVIEALRGRSAVFVVSGSVEVQDIASGASVLLEPGFGVDVRAGVPLAARKQWGTGRVDGVLARTQLP